MKKKLVLLFYCALNFCFLTKAHGQALPDQNNFYTIINKATHEYLLGEKQNLFLNTRLISQAQPGGAGTPTIIQHWRFIKVNTNGVLYYIQIKNSDSVLDIPRENRIIGTPIILHSLNNQENEQFYLIATGDHDTFYISSLSSGYLLDGTRVTAENGKLNIITQTGFNGSDSQKWILVPETRVAVMH